jgi:hypothetical protein
MNNILTAIYDRVYHAYLEWDLVEEYDILADADLLIAVSALYNEIGGRFFLDEAQAGAEFPYLVYSIVSSVKDKTFSEEYRDTLLQFSLFSASSGMAEITNMYNGLSALFDEQPMTITGGTVIWCREENLVTMMEATTTPEGGGSVRHWAVDFTITTKDT